MKVDTMYQESRLIIYLQRFFSLLGLASFSISSSDQSPQLIYKKSNTARIYSILSTILMNIAGSYGIYVLITAFYKFQLNIYTMIEISTNASGLLIASILHAVYCSNTDKSIGVLEKLLKIRRDFDNWFHLNSSLPVLKFLIFSFTFCFINYFIYLGTALLYWDKPIYLAMNFFPNQVIVWFVIQYAILSQVLLMLFRNVNVALKSVGKSNLNLDNRGALFKVTESMKLDALRTLGDLFSRLCKLSSEISDFYGFPILISLSYMFIALVGNTYFVVALVIERKSNLQSIMLVLPLVMIIILHVFCILSLTRTVTNIVSEVNMTNFYMNLLMFFFVICSHS